MQVSSPAHDFNANPERRVNAGLAQPGRVLAIVTWIVGMKCNDLRGAVSSNLASRS